MRSLRGFTLIEILLALVITSVLVLGVATAVMTSQGSAGDAAFVADMETDAQAALERIVDELRQAGPGGPDWALGTGQVAYNLCTGYSGGTATWTAARQLSLAGIQGETLDGDDDNGNGLDDEAALMLTVGGTAFEIVRDVAEGGFTVVQDGNNLAVTLTLRRLNPDGVPVSHTVTSLVSMRNS